MYLRFCCTGHPTVTTTNKRIEKQREEVKQEDGEVNRWDTFGFG